MAGNECTKAISFPEPPANPEVPKGTAPLDYYRNFGLREKIKVDAPEMTREDFRNQVYKQSTQDLKLVLYFQEIERLDKEIEFTAGCNKRAVERLTEAKIEITKLRASIQDMAWSLRDYETMSFWQRLKFLVRP